MNLLDNRKPVVGGRVELKGRDLENIERRKALAANKPPATFNTIRGLDSVKLAPGHLAMGRTNPARDAARESKRIARTLPPMPVISGFVAMAEAAAPYAPKKRAHFGNTWQTTRAERTMTIGERSFRLYVSRLPSGDAWGWLVEGHGGALGATTPTSASGQKPSEKTAKLAARRAAEALAAK